MIQYAKQFDLAGIGIGPSNLSLAALLDPVKEITSVFFESKKEFQWFPGMLFPEAYIQETVCFKDLATPVDPTSKYTFLSFLANQGRLYRFATAGFPRIKRAEYNQYFQWVSRSLANLRFAAEIEEVLFKDDHFRLRYNGGELRAKNIVMACGQTATIPEFARPYLCGSVFHVSQYLRENVDTRGKRIAVIGGGQSGAEIVDRLLSDKSYLPEKVYWVSRRINAAPLDDSPFANEYFAPPYSDYFFRLPDKQRKRLLEQQVMASDGISLNVLNDIYRHLYELELVEGRGRLARLFFDHSLTGLESAHKAWDLSLEDLSSGAGRQLTADIVIFATGFRRNIPSFLDPLLEKIPIGPEGFSVNEDYSIDWDGPKGNKIFVQNAARHVRGIADPNLSLIAWRSARIINSLLPEPHYRLGEESSAFDWQEMLQPESARNAASVNL